jgi:hypothetical protein
VLRQIVVARLEGSIVRNRRLGPAPGTIHRKLASIREK